MTRITARLLLNKRACAEQVRIFRREWPRGVTPSLAACERAAALGLDLEWFAVHFLSAQASAAYYAALAQARAAYRAAVAPALAAYYAATAKALWSAMQAD